MPEPTKIPRPFADSGDKNSIPDSSGSIGFASWQEGFPAITSEPFASGGVAPKRADFNGVFNALSAATVWAQQGGVYAYDNTTDYEIGNVVLYSGNLYQCIVANGPSSAVKAPTQAAFWASVSTAVNPYFPRSSNFALSPETIAGLTITVGTERNYVCGNIIQVATAFTFSGSITTGWIALATADLTSITDIKSAEAYFIVPEHLSAASAAAHRDRICRISVSSGILTVRAYLYAGDQTLDLRPAFTLVGSV